MVSNRCYNTENTTTRSNHISWILIFLTSDGFTSYQVPLAWRMAFQFRLFSTYLKANQTDWCLI